MLPTKSRVNPIVHWEVRSTQPERLERFYADLFGWQLHARREAGYTLIDTAGDLDSGIDGGLIGSQHDCGLLVYVRVSDVAKTLVKAAQLGATIVAEPADRGDTVVALLKDPDGNLIGVMDG